MLGLEYAGDVDDDDVAMRSEPGIGRQLARADLELQFRRRAIPGGSHPALADISRTFGDGPDEREDSRPRLPHAPDRAAPFEIEDVRARLVGVVVNQRESLVALTPGFYVRSEMDLGLLGHPGGLAERGHQLAGARNEPSGVADAVATFVTVPACRHTATLQHSYCNVR